MTETATIHLDTQAPEPLWRQIEQGVERLVAAGTWSRGAAVPSVRDLSRELRVNPATVAKAYQLLRGRGLLTSRRGEGTYVAEEPPRLSPRQLQETLREAALRLASVGHSLGASEDQTCSALKAAWAEFEPTTAPLEGGPRET
jgi:GntR family transcriptional regulator